MLCIKASLDYSGEAFLFTVNFFENSSRLFFSKFAKNQKLFRLLYSLLSCVLFLGSFANHQLTYIGLIIKFNDAGSHQIQIERLKKHDDLTISKNYVLPFKDLIFVEFKQETSSIQEALSIQEDIESLENVAFVSLVKKAITGGIAAHLQEVYVKLNSTNSFNKIKQFCEQKGVNFLRKYEYGNTIYVFTTTKYSLYDSRKIAQLLNEFEEVEYASHNSLYSLVVTEVNDPDFHRQWALKNEGTILQGKGTPGADMQVDSAWTITTGSPNIKVAVLDSGVDTLHPDLKDNMLPGFDAVSDSTKGYPTPNFSSDGHGTCCAGIIAAQGNNGIGTVGIAYSCKIIPIRVFAYYKIGVNVYPITTNAAGVDGINWATYIAKADLLSNSWGIRDIEIPVLGIDTVFGNDVIKTVSKEGREGKGIPLLFSSGNDGDTYAIWPSRVPETISVAATSMCDELKTANDCSVENWTSNHGKDLDIGAPGVRIVTTDMMGAYGYNAGNLNYTFNGTSAACPNAAGVMALILSVDSTLTSKTARHILQTSCEKVGGYDYDSSGTYGSWSFELGYGRVNAYEAVKLALIEKNRPQAPEINSSLVFPNPTSGILYLPTDKSYIVFRLYNTLGVVVWYKESTTQEIREIDLSELTNGIYFLQASSASGKTETYKVLKQEK